MKYLFLLWLIATRLIAPALAQTLDPAFQATLLLNHDEHVQVLALAAQADGKSLVAGDFQVAGSALSNNIIRLNPDRSRDPSFRSAPGANGTVSCLVVQADGKLLIAGNFAAYAGTATGPVARLLPSGELDATFQLPSALAGTTVRTLAVQPDGKVLVGGAASAALPGGLVRLLPNGTLNASFNAGTGAGSGGQVFTLAVQPVDGKVVVGGQFASFGGRASQSLLRLLPSGTPDASFAASGFDATAVVYSVALYANGNVLAGGTMRNNYTYPTGLLARLLPTGVPDPQFSTTVNFGGLVLRVRVMADNRALVGGYFLRFSTKGVPIRDTYTSVGRLLADGSLDPGFMPPTEQSYSNDKMPFYFDMLPQPDGQLLLGGMLIESSHYALSLFSATGIPDNSFNLDLKWRGSVGTAVPLASGQLLVSGTYTSLNGQTAGGQWQRLNADGSFTQNIALPVGVGNVSSSFPQPDGRFYVVGYTQTCPGGCGFDNMTVKRTYRVYRVAANNTLDASFTPVELGTSVSSGMGGMAAASVQFVLPYPNGDILLAGESGGSYSVPFQPRLVRYLPTGVAASSFTPPAFPARSRLDQALLQPNGNLVVSYHLATGESQLVRLLANGSLDASFILDANPARPAGATFSATLLQPDGKLLVTGTFTSFGGVATPCGVVRLHPDGTVDAGFQPPAGLAPLMLLAALPDGRLLARATSQPGAARLVRLLPDGALDATFTPVTLSVAGFATPNWSVVLQPTDGKPVLYGDFDSVAGQPRIGLARLGGGAPLAGRPASGAPPPLSLYPNPAHQSATLVLPAALAQAGSVQLYDALGREVYRQAAPAHVQELALSLTRLYGQLVLYS